MDAAGLNACFTSWQLDESVCDEKQKPAAQQQQIGANIIDANPFAHTHTHTHVHTIQLII